MPVVLSMRGRKLDMAALAAANAFQRAIGNAGLNARGDKLDARGNIVKTREQIMSEYNTRNPKAVKHVGLNGIQGEVMTPKEALAHARKMAEQAQTQPQVQQPVQQKEKPKRKIIDSGV